MSDLQSVGVVGLGVMGSNLALNIADHAYTVSTYDPWPEARHSFAGILKQSKPEGIKLYDSIETFITALEAPRIILIMVKAGQTVDQIIDSLLPYLQPGDTLIDGGNSHYSDTISRERKLHEAGLHFLGLGVSGGEEGARFGPSLMAGGSTKAYEQCHPILEAISAKFHDSPCCARVGKDGAGHFVKMIHNGIEYGIKQAISETYVMLRDVVGLDHNEMANVFRNWNEGELSSYLIEITAIILDTQDDLGERALVEQILDKAGQKGTGRWSSETALKLGIPTPSITESVFARALAAMKEERVKASKVLMGPTPSSSTESSDRLIETLRHGLFGSIISIFAQGLGLIEAGSREHQFGIDLSVTTRIWRDGCIIRAALLDKITAAYSNVSSPLNLMCVPEFSEHLVSLDGGWRDTICLAIQNGIPVPALSSALHYYDGYRSAELSANMIQAQRDFFGAHTYERKDRPGTFHTQWGKDSITTSG